VVETVVEDQVGETGEDADILTILTDRILTGVGSSSYHGKRSIGFYAEKELQQL
jgi:hypothetical protein